MNISISTVTQHEYEGFWYIEYHGEFYKGCKRCAGTGHYSFNGYDSICYLCNNVLSARLGDHFDTQAAAQKWCHGRALAKANRERKAEEKRQAKLAKRTAAWDALEAEHPAVWALLTSVLNVRDWDKPEGDVYPSTNERNSFVLKMADQLWHLDEWGYSEKMIAALEKIAEKRAGAAFEAESADPVVAGRVEIKGTVISTKSYETDYGTAYKMLVKDERGFKVFGSIPTNLWSEVEFLGAYRKSAWNETDGVMTKLVGMELQFTATVEASRNDKSFGFFKRPAKAVIIK